jgi:hypothetical protein
MGMYLRRTQRRRKDGSVVGYLQLAHNRRVGGVVQAEVLLNLGREDELDVEGLRRLARSIARYTDGGEATGALEEAAGSGLRVNDARPFGSAWVLDALWLRLGIGRALGEVLADRRHRHDVERALFALVCNRAIHPESKLAAAGWVSHDAAIPGLDALESQHAYRAMDVLASADTEGRVRRRCSSRSPTCSTWRSTCCSSTRPRRTSRSRTRTSRAMRPASRCGASGTPRTTGPTAPRP